MTLADAIAEWDAHYGGESAEPGRVHPVFGEAAYSHWWRKFPQGLRAAGGDSKLDTPLCYEINRLSAPTAPPDTQYDRMLARWFGDGWETR